MYVWWPGITKDIEQTVRRCSACQDASVHATSCTIAPMELAYHTRPCARLHIDYAGPFQGKMILVLIDAHSKWIEATCTQNATSAAVIDELRLWFARFGIPETIVSDNGTCFVSEEIEAFFRSNGIQHLTSAPYHPASRTCCTDC